MSLAIARSIRSVLTSVNLCSPEARVAFFQVTAATSGAGVSSSCATNSVCGRLRLDDTHRKRSTRIAHWPMMRASCT